MDSVSDGGYVYVVVLQDHEIDFPFYLSFSVGDDGI